MKKIIILILMLLMFPACGKTEELLPPGSGITKTKETNPIYFGYMEEYKDAIKAAFKKRKMVLLPGWGASVEYIITRDGQIKNMEMEVYQNPYYDRQVREIIKSVKPIPFKEGMELDEMIFGVYLGHEKKYKDEYCFIGASGKRYNYKTSFVLHIEI